MEKGEKGTVCVTGATGYVASWLIKRLLLHGYSVHATVRSHPENKKDISFLTTLPGASKRLKIFNADLNEAESFIPALEGCIGVFHLAHPMHFRGEEPEKTITNRAVQGVIGILRACLDTKTVKRIVLTGSVSSIITNNNNGGTDNDDMLDESSWSDLDIVRARTSKASELATYPISKTLAEKAALEFANANDLDLVVVIPPIISGPFLLPYVPNSVSLSLIPLFGNPFGYPTPTNMGLVHIDDVARAQIFLFEHPHANGRYICSATDVAFNEVSDFLANKYPDLYHKKELNSMKKMKGVKTPIVSSKKLLETGFMFKYGVAEIYDDAINCYKQKGFP